MTDHRTVAKGPLQTLNTTVTMADLPMDEAKVDLGAKFFAVRDKQCFATAPLSNRMQAAWGVFTAIRTGTDKENSIIYVYKADPLDPGAVQVNRTGTQNAVNFSLVVPLDKINLSPSAGYQWHIIPQELTPTDGPTVFVIDLKTRYPVPRNLKEEQSDASASNEAKSEAAQATTAATPTPSAPTDPAKRARQEALEQIIGERERELTPLYEELAEIDK